MAIKIVLLFITVFFITWGLCRSKQTDELKIRKTDKWFLISSLIICIAMTALGWVMHLRTNLWFLLIPAVSISLMCIYTKRNMKYEPSSAFTFVEKGLLVLLVVFLCSGIVDSSIYMYGIRRLTHFYMGSMFYKMLGGWILAELVFCRQFPLALVKSFFLIVLTVNVARFILLFTSLNYINDGLSPIIQIGISLLALCYMCYKKGYRLKLCVD